MTDQKGKAPADFSAKAQTLLDKEGSSPKPGMRPAEKLIADFAARWPSCFYVYEKRRRPLTIGIHKNVIAALDGVASKTAIKLALSSYTSNLKYLAPLKAGATRIDLNGQPAGVVTVEESRVKKTEHRKPPPQVARPASDAGMESRLHPANAAKPRLSLPFRKEVRS